MDRVERTAETERLRSALLTSISHDLKTPLAAVLGAAGTLRDLADQLTDGEKADLLATVIDESERLNRFIANLLDMTKLESGAVAPKLAPHDLSEIVGSTLRRAAKILRIIPSCSIWRPTCRWWRSMPSCSSRCCSICSTMRPSTPLPERPSCIRTWRDRHSVALQVIDEGEGIPQDDLGHIFDKFYRVQKTDQVRPGTGLGLAISRGFVEAMHGTIAAANRHDRRGAVFTITLPIPREQQRLDAAA